MTSRQLILVLVILIGLGILFTAGKLLLDKPAETVSPSPTVSVDPTVTPTPTATQSPTGTSPTGTTGSLKTTVGSKMTANGVSIKPLEVVEDSRCGIDVQCIQAGTVRVRVEMSENGPITMPTLELMKPFTYGKHTVTLTAVSPAPRAGQKIPPASYTFTFEVK